MPINKNIKKFYLDFWEKSELLVANLISNIQEIRNLNKYIDKTARLTSEQKKQIRTFWKPYKKISTRWCKYYSTKNGKFDPRYIPNTPYYTKIDQYFNNRRLGYGFNDKNYYSKIFAGIPQPKCVIRKINGLIFDEHYHQLTIEDAAKRIFAEQEVICKPSLETGSGRGILFLKTDRDQQFIKDFLRNKKYDDYIIQKIIQQHNDLAKIHPTSINTIRIASILLDDGVHILSSCLRMGTGNSRIDNVTSGGISCGIKEDGCIDKFAYTYYSGEKSDRHPQGMIFDGFKIPSFDKACDLVRKAHPIIAHFRLVSWDIAIDQNGEALLIEANMRKGGLNLLQFNNGPLFGDLTKKILDEVFGKRNDKNE